MTRHYTHAGRIVRFGTSHCGLDPDTLTAPPGSRNPTRRSIQRSGGATFTDPPARGEALLS